MEDSPAHRNMTNAYRQMIQCYNVSQRSAEFIQSYAQLLFRSCLIVVKSKENLKAFNFESAYIQSNKYQTILHYFISQNS